MDLIQPWLDLWKVCINQSKTSVICFSNKSTTNIPKLEIKRTPIYWSNSIKYLGVHIDNKFRFIKHAEYYICKINGLAHILFSLINQKSPIPLSIKLYIYMIYNSVVVKHVPFPMHKNRIHTSKNTTHHNKSPLIRQPRYHQNIFKHTIGKRVHIYYLTYPKIDNTKL